MKQSTNLFIAAICLLMLAIFIESGTFPELAKALRLFTAAGIITLCLSGRAERIEDKEKHCHEERQCRPVARSEHNYSPDYEHLYNRFIILKRVDKLIEEITNEKKSSRSDN